MITILFDATRLLMRASRTSPTGIDRVTVAYGRWLLARADVRVIPICSLGGVVSTLSPGHFRRILQRSERGDAACTDRWSRLAAALEAPGDATGVLRAAKPRFNPFSGKAARYSLFGLRTLANFRPTRYGAGAIYLNVSHFGLEQPRLLDRLAARGVRSVAMVHDIIPIAHPEYCSAPAEKLHVLRIEALFRHGALIIANSRSTAEELLALGKRQGRSVPPICVAPLGLEPAFTDRSMAIPNAKPYFVCVGTIEPRKNVAFLLTLWRRLEERMGESTPPLVLAGQRGWENEAIIDHLERSPPIRRFVHEVTGLTDEALARLIAGANALLAPSFSEGFNLPVAEAAALGTPVIASDIPVHRELARHAQLIDPLDGPAWLAAIQTAAARRPWSRATAPFGWPDHFAIVAEAIGLAPAKAPAAAAPPRERRG